MYQKITALTTMLALSELNFDELMKHFGFGEIYLARGSQDKEGLARITKDSEALAIELSNNFDSLGKAPEKLGVINSKVQKLKTGVRIIEGRRTTTVSLFASGSGGGLEPLLEDSKFSENKHTILVKSAKNNDVLIIDGLHWVCEWFTDSDGSCKMQLSTMFHTKIKNHIHRFENIPDRS